MMYRGLFIGRFNFLSALTLLLITLPSCSTNTCNEAEGKILQVYETEKEVLRTFLIDHGAFGETVTLSICNKQSNKLIEEIVIRGEDDLPTIDSVVGTNVYIHYTLPGKENLLDFKAVALGDALLFPEKLKYKYIIWNKKTEGETSSNNAANKVFMQ